MSDNKLALIGAEELSFVPDNVLNGEQLKHILKKTPPQFVKKRPAKGGGQWDYVTGGYVKKCLNLMFGWDWDFEIVSEMVQGGEAIVKGKLTCRSAGKTIVKMQYGNKDIICKKGTAEPLSLGNDLKAAATDALKKCAAEIGIAADIYNKEDFKEVVVDSNKIDEEQLNELYKLKSELLPHDEQLHIERIIKNKEVKSYRKTFNYLSKL